ncbi:AP2/ERF and B3 domain-containing transcription factor At1g50680-like [Hibiscus syriacus]|nr:AP2/ERF and B3 domain-containing transcription factor At1g50680-like [Hibiscus syriacus]
MISRYKRRNPHYFFTAIDAYLSIKVMVGRLISNNKMTPYQNIRGSSTSTGIRKSTSRFRGVLPLANHKWGSRISFDYRAYWLGTYEIEEEAAIAYDRAALKLQKANTTLNLPHKINTPQEKSFQSWYSEEEILNMIKYKTYSSSFTSFLAHQSLARRTIPGSLLNARGLSYELLFHQELRQTDVANPRGFPILKEYALRYLPPLGSSSGNGAQMGSDSIDITFYDKYYASWTLRYSYSGRIQAFCFTTGWRQFVTKNNLNSGDTVVFYGCYHVDYAGQRGMFYMIDILRNSPGNYIVGNGGAQGFGSDAADGTEGVNGSNGVKLFGVIIC